MARTKRSIAGRFLKSYARDLPNYDQATEQATALIKEILVNSPALIHVISSRCKGLPSLRLKLAEKGYKQPKRQLTDLIAARVITYYKDAVPIVVKALSDALEIEPHKSVDKREELEAVEFGYTSVHLIARTRGGWSTSPKYFALRDKWFEIRFGGYLSTHGRKLSTRLCTRVESNTLHPSGDDSLESLVRSRYSKTSSLPFVITRNS